MPIDHIETMTRHLADGLREHRRTLAWPHCPWVGAVGSVLLDIIYELSWLAHRLPLSQEHRMVVVAISDRLAARHNVFWAGVATSSNADQAHSIELISKLHWHAASVLADLVLDADVQPCESSSGPHLQDGLTIVDELCQADILYSVLIWPLVVLSTAIHTHDQMVAYKAVAAKALKVSGLTGEEQMSFLVDKIFELRLVAPRTSSAKEVLRFIASSGVLF